MPKPSTYPTLFNEALQLNISKLKGWDYLEQSKRGVINWSSNGSPIGSISIRSRITDDQKNIELDYKFRDEPRKYKIQLVSVPSNLGKGSVWYFLCPETGKRCRKLYSIGGYFLHRSAFRGCMYISQTKSKKWREMEILFGSYFDKEGYIEQLYSKHFKKFYNGKPTKRYLKLLKKIDEADRHSVRDIEKLMLS
jgi:hypothetical protein